MGTQVLQNLIIDTPETSERFAEWLKREYTFLKHNTDIHSESCEDLVHRWKTWEQNLSQYVFAKTPLLVSALKEHVLLNAVDFGLHDQRITPVVVKIVANRVRNERALYNLAKVQDLWEQCFRQLLQPKTYYGNPCDEYTMDTYTEERWNGVRRILLRICEFNDARHLETLCSMQKKLKSDRVRFCGDPHDKERTDFGFENKFKRAEHIADIKYVIKFLGEIALLKHAEIKTS